MAKAQSTKTLSLSEAIPGTWYAIDLIPIEELGVLEKIQQFQILPGKMIKVVNKFPMFVIETENAKLVIDTELASKILVNS